MEGRERPHAAGPHRGESRGRRVIEITLFVGVWVGLGELLDMNPNIYLVVGIPLTVAFQLYVARRPLHEMWVKHAAAFHLTERDLMLAGVLAIVPVITLVSDVSDDAGLPFYLIAPAASRASTSSSSSSTCSCTSHRSSCSRRSSSAGCSTPTSSTRASTTGC